MKRRPIQRSTLGVLLLSLLGLALTVLLFAVAPQDAAETSDIAESTATASPMGVTPPRAFLRGMTVTCPRSGQIWGTPEMSQALDQLRPLGVEWVAIHPYARIGRDGTVSFRPAATSEFLTAAVERVRASGMKLFWKPHLAYWGNFSWRGEIDFGDDEAAWDRFFQSYREFIADQASFAESHGVPLLAVGVELEGSVRFETRWRAVVAAVRKVYRGEITYAANWDRSAAVPFWDAVDLIGVQAYFPLSEAPNPPAAALAAGWESHLEGLRELSRRFSNKPVLFTEIGYNRSAGAARQPWDYSTEDTPDNRALRQRLIAVALESLEEEPVVRGVFWWKWMPGHSAGRSNFSMRDPEAQEALVRAWGPPARPGSAAKAK